MFSFLNSFHQAKNSVRVKISGSYGTFETIFRGRSEAAEATENRLLACNLELENENRPILKKLPIPVCSKMPIFLIENAEENKYF